MRIYLFNILIFNFLNVFYMFWTRVFISKKTAVYTVRLWYVLHASG